jgi:hypothetical protein
MNLIDYLKRSHRILNELARLHSEINTKCTGLFEIREEHCTSSNRIRYFNTPC